MKTKKIKKITKKQLEKEEKKRLNKLWKEVRQQCIDRDGGCVICGAKKGDTYINKKGKIVTVYPTAHHLIPREIEEMFYDIDNLITLCPTHHKYSLEISPHRNPLVFFVWLQLNRNTQLQTVMKKYRKLNNGKVKGI